MVALNHSKMIEWEIKFGKSVYFWKAVGNFGNTLKIKFDANNSFVLFVE